MQDHTWLESKRVVGATAELVALDAERRKRKEDRRSADDRILDPWERYKAVSDQCDRLLDLTELYDRKARFALIILGILNAMNVIFVTRGQLGQAAHLPFAVMAYIACYALLSLGLLWTAISALRPGDQPDEAVDLSPDEYCDRWKRMEIGDLGRTVAHSAHRLSRTNAAKLAAVNRLYARLTLLAALTAILIAALGIGVVNAPPA